MTATRLNEFEKLKSVHFEQTGRIVEPDKVGSGFALFAIMDISSRTFPNELDSLDLDHYFPCRSTVHFFLGYQSHGTDKTSVPCRSIFDDRRLENP